MAMWEDDPDVSESWQLIASMGDDTTIVTVTEKSYDVVKVKLEAKMIPDLMQLCSSGVKIGDVADDHSAEILEDLRSVARHLSLGVSLVVCTHATQPPNSQSTPVQVAVAESVVYQ